MRKIITVLLLLLLQNFCFCQNTSTDSLKAKLATAKDDTERLQLYIELGNTPGEKDYLSYIEPAWNIINGLFAKNDKAVPRQQLIDIEMELPDLVVTHFSYGDSTDWNKALPYLFNRLQFIEKTGDKNRQAAFLYSIAHIFLDAKKDSANFRTYITKSIAMATAIKDTALIVRGYRFQCSFYLSAGNFSEAVEAIQSSIAISRQFDYKPGLAKSLNDLASLYAEFGEDDLALKNFQTALDIAYDIRDTNQVQSTLIELSNFYRQKNDSKKALAYLNRGLALNNGHSKLDYNTGVLFQLIGEVYSDQKDYKNAMLNFEENLRKSEAAKDVGTTARALVNIGTLYSQQGDFSKALTYHTRTLQLLDSMGNLGAYKRYKPFALYIIALDQFGLKKYVEAKANNDRALVDFKRMWFDIKDPSQMELLAVQIDSALGDGFGAFEHYKAYTLLNDKIKGDDIRKEAQKDKFKMETDKQKAEQEQKDAIATRTRNLQYVAIGAFLLLGIFLLYGYTQKNKDKKRIEKAYAELKSTQAQLIQSEKMASLGELTAGIAHEIQNPLNFVNNFSEINNELIDELKSQKSKLKSEEQDELLDDIFQNNEKINHHGKRADAIVKGMLQHSQSSAGKKEPTDINKLADEYLRLAYHGLRSKDKNFNATLKTDFDESIGNINIIPQDIGRVMLNLFNNAFYAVKEKQKSVSAQELTSFEKMSTLKHYEPTVLIRTKKIGNKILIEVDDNGNGIPSLIVDKIFQPFFTTKPTGQGTGLGLSLSYDIVTKGHSGELKVETKDREGSAFIIQLPA